MNNNMIEISGRVVSDFEFDYEQYGERFYTLKIASKRLSGVSDILTLLISDKKIFIDEDILGQNICVTGEVRTHNYKDEFGTHLKVVIFVQTLDVLNISEVGQDINTVHLNGYLCKKSDIRQTPKGKNIVDTIVAVNRMQGRNDYIPCIFWNKNASYINDEDIGENILITGRLQSRDYSKNINDTIITKTTYEVSVQSVEEPA